MVRTGKIHTRSFIDEVLVDWSVSRITHQLIPDDEAQGAGAHGELGLRFSFMDILGLGGSLF